MKYGFVFECWIDGPDSKVLKYLVNWIKPDCHFEPVTLGDKGVLLEECADSVELLLKNSDKVFIVWDLMPKYANCDCIVEERNLIRQQLIDKNVPLYNVEFIGIVHELESWLIADVSAIERVLSTPEHAVSIDNIRHPDREVNPKKKLRRLFNQNRGTDYNDLESAIKIIKQVQRPRDMRQSVSFKRFYLKLTGNILK
jgi:hypothetical protein